MAISAELRITVRVLINDLGSSPEYSDNRIDTLIAVGAKYVQQENNFTTLYTINIETPDISPDPTASSTEDIPFTNLTALKAACTADLSTFRTQALQAGIKAKIGPAALETISRLNGFKDIMALGPCKLYDDLRKQYMFGDFIAVESILSPFTSNNFDASLLSPVNTLSDFRHNRP